MISAIRTFSDRDFQQAPYIDQRVLLLGEGEDRRGRVKGRRKKYALNYYFEHNAGYHCFLGTPMALLRGSSF